MLDDGPSEPNLRRLRARGIPYLGTVKDNLGALAGARYVVAVGDPAVRRRLVATLAVAGARPHTLVHPSAVLGSEVRTGAGSVVCAGVQVSTNVTLGRHAHLNPGCIVGHDTVLGEFVSLNPGAILSGVCTVEDGVLVGAGATVLQGLTLGAGSLVGAAACVTRSVPPRAVATGVPARWPDPPPPAPVMAEAASKERHT